MEDGELQNFENEISFKAPDLTTAKQLQHLLSNVIAASTKEVSPKDFSWLQAQFTGFDQNKVGIVQTLHIRESNNCKLSLETREQSRNKVNENLYEFNLQDLDSKNMEIDVSKKHVVVNLPTIYQEEIVKNYENGGKIKYTDEVTVLVPESSIKSRMLLMVKF